MKKIKYLSLLFIVGLLTFSSCTSDWEEMNVDPNNPTDVPSTNVLAHALRHPAQVLFDDWQGMNNFCSYAGQVTKIQYTDEAHYIYRETTVNSAWSNYYLNLLDLKKLIIKGQDGVNDEYEENITAAAIVYSVFLWQMATDQWGDIPYSEALSAEEGITAPAYDSQQDIYTDLIARLKEASTMFDLAGAASGSDILGDGDILYNGDVAKWQKFCNSLRLRIAIRISYVDEAAAGAIISEILGDPTKYPIFESNADAAIFNWVGVLPYVEPWYDNGLTRDDHGMANTLITNLTDLADPRIAVYAELDDAGAYSGQVEGAGTNMSVSRIGAFFRDNPSGGTYFMRYAELEFILAEIYARGIGVAANDATAQSHYEAGIIASFDEYGLDATSYLSATGVAWGDDVTAVIDYGTPGLTYDGKMKQIYVQKWIALFKQGQELWAESRRVDFPQVPVNALSPFTGHTRQAFRYPYPTDESNLNSANLAAVSSGIVDEFWGKQMWWDTRTGVK